MNQPMFIEGLIATSASAYSHGTIPLVRARTLSITTQVTCGSSVDADTTVYLYYSPDGNNWDTIEYTSFDLTYSAGNTVQRTVNIDVPEHGYMKTKVTNGSSADTLTAVKLWYSIQAWPDTRERSRGDIRIDPGEERGGN